MGKAVGCFPHLGISMTVQEFITQYDMDHENTATNAQKIRWLQRIELSVMSDVMHRYNDKDKSGIFGDKLMYGGDFDDVMTGNTMDISEDPEMYIEGDTLVLTEYEGSDEIREAQEMDADTFLQIPIPYDNVYEYYLDMMIAHATGDIKTYNNSAELFNRAYMAFRKYYARNNFINRHHNHLIRHEAL